MPDDKGRRIEDGDHRSVLDSDIGYRLTHDGSRLTPDEGTGSALKDSGGKPRLGGKGQWLKVNWNLKFLNPIDAGSLVPIEVGCSVSIKVGLLVLVGVNSLILVYASGLVPTNTSGLVLVDTGILVPFNSYGRVPIGTNIHSLWS